MAKKTTDETSHEDEHFENTPSSLDEMTHMELRLLHREASEAILFAKNIQWRSVGAALLVFGGCIAITVITKANLAFANILSSLTILLTCGVVFVLLMYQFWQFNEISRIKQIEQHFSTLYTKISHSKSRREGNAHRYTLLMFMMVVVVLGAVVTNVAIKFAIHKPPF